MTNFLLILVSLLSGLAFNISKTLPQTSYKSINAWVLYIALPALSLRYIPEIEWSRHMILPAIAPFVVWIGSTLAIQLYSKYTPLNAQTKGVMKLAMGLSNTSFLGFPLIAAYYSEKELSIAIVYDQMNFIVLSTLGIIATIRAAQKETLSARGIALRALKFPPFIAFIVALVLSPFIDFSPANPLLDKLVLTVGPLALFSIGLQLKFDDLKADAAVISYGLVYKLIIAPMLILALALAFKAKGLVPQITVFEASMPAFVTGSLVAEQYGLNPRLINLMVGIGIFAALFTSALWWLINTLAF